MFSGGKVHFSNESLKDLKELIEGREVDYRGKIQALLAEHKSREEILNFDQLLVQPTIEEAIEPTNPVCTVQLRNIVYVHNQLVRYGQESIYIKGYASDNVLGQDASLLEDQTPIKQESSGDSDEGSAASEEDLEMDPIKMIMEQLGNQYIILKVYEREFIPQRTLDKSINFLIRTRVFERFSEIVRCSDCNAVVYEGLLPKQRFEEGLRMKKWRCGNRKCKHFNTVEMSLQCKKCKMPRPRGTLPADLMFPLYVPLNPTIEVNRQVTLMEQLLQIIPVVGVSEDFGEKLKSLKAQEKAKAVKDFDKINIIEDFGRMKEGHLAQRKAELGILKFDTDEAEVDFIQTEEEAFFTMLTERIQ